MDDNNEDRRGDDMFANSSTETVVQNIDFSLILMEAAKSQHEVSATAECSYRATSPQGEVSHLADPSYRASNSEGDTSYPADPSFKAECFVSEVCNFALQLHCPFCCKHFAFEYMLKEHIKLEHEKYWEMLRSDNHILLLHSCLFCHAKYYKKRVLLRHILYSHQEVVVAVCHKDQLCTFCPYTTVAPSRSKLLYHIEQNHAKEFEILIDSMYSHNGKLEDTMASSQHTFPSTSHTQLPANYNSAICEAVETTGILSPIPKSGRTVRKRLRFDQPDDDKYKDITLPSKKTSKWKKFVSFIKLKKNQNDVMIPKFTTSTPKPLSDRKSLMDNNIYYLDYDAPKKKKETSFNKIQKKRFSFNIFSRKKNKYHSFSNKRPSETGITPTRIFKRNINVRKPACGNRNTAAFGNNGTEVSCKWADNDDYKIKQFKCAVCLEAFGDNVGLVCHAKRHHNGPLRLLQPSFKCGLCEATFYKNSFLLRHCKFHHTPLCLRN